MKSSILVLALFVTTAFCAVIPDRLDHTSLQLISTKALVRQLVMPSFEDARLSVQKREVKLPKKVAGDTDFGSYDPIRQRIPI